MNPFSFSSVETRKRLGLRTSTVAISAALTVAMGVPTLALAQTAQPVAATAEEEITVTGTRIVRDGYEAPTPVTVVGVEELQNSASPGMMDYLAQLPALSGSKLTTNNQLFTTTGQAGSQGADLRSLGGNRTLVLLDGQRVVGIDYNGAVNIGSFPSQLIERVDIVTGGASAVYGSDAVAGVMNFILDKDFTGVKGEIGTGITAYGDDFNYDMDLTAGFPFGGGRGHVLLSGSHLNKEGIDGDGGRSWNDPAVAQITNPNYNGTNGQPRLLILPQVSSGAASHGGLIVSGPLKGIAFGEGGTPYRFNYGEIYANPYMAGGGDWRENKEYQNYWLDTKQKDYSFFGRVSYDITDNINAFVQYDWAQSESYNRVGQYWFFGGATGPQIRVDNAFLPATVRAAMVANNLTSVQLGTLNKDMGEFGPHNAWISNRVYAGLDGDFDAMDTTWSWNFTYGYGSTKQAAHTDLHKDGVPIPEGYGLVTSLFMQSVDSVFHPVTGEIVCRVALTNPATTCKPWNVMGLNVNEGRVPSFVTPNYQYGLIEQTTYSGTLTGEPFAVPAGPVSVALNVAYREVKMNAEADIDAKRFDRPTGNHSALHGASSVSEAALETVIPLAKGESWAEAWDLSAAVRATDYKLSGFVATWKVGTTYAPTDEIRFRLTRSRDIREPNLQEQFAEPNQTGSGTIIDRFRNNTNYVTLGQRNASNPTLRPEKADSWNIGAVYSPMWLEGFTTSIDYFRVAMKDSVYYPNQQQVMDLCFEGRTDLCGGISRNATSGLVETITVVPINLASQRISGLDLEATYRTPVSALVSDWDGDLTLKGVASVYFENLIDDTFNPPVNYVGENAPRSPTSTSPPFWKFNITASYRLDAIAASLTGRAVSSGYINRSYIECTTACPAATAANNTINNNRMPGAYYLDANVSYSFFLGEAVNSQFYVSAKNILNRGAEYAGGGTITTSMAGYGSVYDTLGTVFRAGFRFSMK